MGRAGRIAAGLVGAVVLILVLAQLILPAIATSRIGSRLKRYGRVGSVSVSAWPAVRLLWGSADSVTVRATDLKLSPSQAAKLVWEARGVDTVEMTSTRVRLGRLQLSGVSLRKRGDQLSGAAAISEADAGAALPAGLSVQLLGSDGGRVRVRASGGLFGVGASVEAVAGPTEGKLAAHPLGPLLEGLQLTLFADPHVYVEGIAASALGGVGGAGYRVSMSARLR